VTIPSTQIIKADVTHQSFIHNILKIVAGGMILSSFAAYLTAQYFPLNTPIIFSSFLLLLVVSYLADDGDSRLNLNRPKAGILIFSVLFGVFLGSVLGYGISSFLMTYLAGASFFLIMGFYGSLFKQDLHCIESFIVVKYVVIFIAVFFKIVVGCDLLQFAFIISGMVFLAFICGLCVSELEEVYLYYRESKSKTDLNFIGAFKLYNAFFRLIWIFFTLRIPFLYFFHWDLIKVPRNKEIEQKEPLEVKEEPPHQSSKA